MSAGRRMLNLAARVIALALVAGMWHARPVAAQTEVVEYYGQDALGSIRIVFNASGAAIARADYEPFGELFTVPGMPGTSGLPAQQFTGQERDAEASLDYFGARFFVPRTGRFSQVDPVYSGLFDPQQWNRYAYVRNNPLMYVDPDGRQVIYDLRAPGGANFSAGTTWVIPGVVSNPLGHPTETSNPLAVADALALAGSCSSETKSRACGTGEKRGGRDGSMWKTTLGDRLIGEMVGGDGGDLLAIAADLTAGFGDTISLGLTDVIRTDLDWNVVNHDSDSYQVGEALGYVHQALSQSYH